MPTSAAAEPPFSNITRQANRLMDQMQKSYFSFCPSETWTPSVNLYETAESYLVCADLAGVDKSKIDVEVVDQVVKLKGTRSVPTFDPDAHEGESAGESAAPGTAAGTSPAGGVSAAGGAGAATGSEHRRIRIHLMEIDHGSFCREVELPEDVDRERISATYRNGMLWIELPKVTPGAI
jgi:HSP20 family molecular chaperone IbpA